MKRILIVEDQPTSRELLRAVLERQGHHVHETANGQEALQAVSEYMPDLVLMDLQIPAPDGYAVLKVIRSNNQLSRLPVLALTASAMQGDREKALQAGFTGYLAKPVALDDLRREVNRLLGIE
jgi:two-component system, cell cycle response regulator DivK